MRQDGDDRLAFLVIDDGQAPALVLDFPKRDAEALPFDESSFPALDGANNRSLRILMEIERESL